LSKVDKWDIRFLQLARHVSEWSKDPSTKTGAVITQGKRVISMGYNGFPADMMDTPELYANREEKYSRIVHCEVNALIFAGRLPNDSTLYTWPFPSCDRCVVQMIQAGIERFVAPVPSKESIERWGPAFEKTKKYIQESRRWYLEVPMEMIVGQEK
jgi:dCMP deaminase